MEQKLELTELTTDCQEWTETVKTMQLNFAFGFRCLVNVGQTLAGDGQSGERAGALHLRVLDTHINPHHPPEPIRELVSSHVKSCQRLQRQRWASLQSDSGSAETHVHSLCLSLSWTIKKKHGIQDLILVFCSCSKLLQYKFWCLCIFLLIIYYIHMIKYWHIFSTAASCFETLNISIFF